MVYRRPLVSRDRGAFLKCCHVAALAGYGSDNLTARAERRSGFYGDQWNWLEHTYRVFNSVKLVCSNLHLSIASLYFRNTLVTMVTLVDSSEIALAALPLVQGGGDPSDSLSHATWP